MEMPDVTTPGQMTLCRRPPEPSHNTFGHFAVLCPNSLDLMDGTCATPETGLPSLRSHASKFGP